MTCATNMPRTRLSALVVLAALLPGFAQDPIPIPCKFGKKYCHVTKVALATGSSAMITTRSTTLCGEPTSTAVAASAAWAGVTKYDGQTPVKWAQIGYYRLRESGTTTILVERYTETRYGTGPLDIERRRFPGVPSGNHEYKCFLFSPAFGVWHYYFDELPLWTTQNYAGWVGDTGNTYAYTAEIFNRQDQMVGTVSNKCNFTQCQFTTSYNGDGFQDAAILPGDLFTSDATQWGIEWLSGTAFNVWDKNP